MTANRIYHPLVVALGGAARARAGAIAEIRRALAKHDGVIGDAASELKCDRRTLTRWLARDELSDVRAYAATLRARAGKPGRK